MCDLWFGLSRCCPSQQSGNLTLTSRLPSGLHVGIDVPPPFRYASRLPLRLTSVCRAFRYALREDRYERRARLSARVLRASETRRGALARADPRPWREA